MLLIFWQISTLSLIVGSQGIWGELKQSAFDWQIWFGLDEICRAQQFWLEWQRNWSASGWIGRDRLCPQLAGMEPAGVRPHLLVRSCTKLPFLPLLFFFVPFYTRNVFCLSCSFFMLLNHTLFLILVLASSSQLLSYHAVNIGFDLCSINLCCSNTNP